MLTKSIVFFIDLYRTYLSPIKGPTCKYFPTCSAYAREAVLTHGAIAGTGLSLWRILRCNPFSRGGFDPVPPLRRHFREAKEVR